MRSFVIIGRTATASATFLLEDLPGSSGRLDVLLRCIRAATLYSHGLRQDVRVYLLLRGGPAAPRVLRIDSNQARFIRPDERSLALLVKKTLAAPPDEQSDTFAEIKAGVALAHGDLDCVLSDVAGAARYVLEAGGMDVRGVALGQAHSAFFLGDHLGFEAADRDRLIAEGATPLSVGPLTLHTDDVVTLLSNELDRSHPSNA